MTSENMPSEEPPPEKPPTGVATMSVVRWVLVGIAAIVAVGSIFSYTGLHRAGSAKSEAPVQLYQCPMHPSIVQDHPGECPICGMT
ncbi:MAG TPA: heavy metal-binding domain-containing protein, partial [Polyangia bacterium]